MRGDGLAAVSAAGSGARRGCAAAALLSASAEPPGPAAPPTARWRQHSLYGGWECGEFNFPQWYRRFHAATSIQRLVRGVQSRRRVAAPAWRRRRLRDECMAQRRVDAAEEREARTGLAAVEHEAACNIELGYETAAALLLQAMWRGHATRRWARAERDALTARRQQAAAVWIQSAYRGHCGRKEYRERRLEAGLPAQGAAERRRRAQEDERQQRVAAEAGERRARDRTAEERWSDKQRVTALRSPRHLCLGDEHASRHALLRRQISLRAAAEEARGRGAAEAAERVALLPLRERHLGVAVGGAEALLRTHLRAAQLAELRRLRVELVAGRGCVREHNARGKLLEREGLMRGEHARQFRMEWRLVEPHQKQRNEIERDERRERRVNTEWETRTRVRFGPRCEESLGVVSIAERRRAVIHTRARGLVEVDEEWKSRQRMEFDEDQARIALRGGHALGRGKAEHVTNERHRSERGARTATAVREHFDRGHIAAEEVPERVALADVELTARGRLQGAEARAVALRRLAVRTAEEQEADYRRVLRIDERRTFGSLHSAGVRQRKAAHDATEERLTRWAHEHRVHADDESIARRKATEVEAQEWHKLTRLCDIDWSVSKTHEEARVTAWAAEQGVAMGAENLARRLNLQLEQAWFLPMVEAAELDFRPYNVAREWVARRFAEGNCRLDAAEIEARADRALDEFQDRVALSDTGAASHRYASECDVRRAAALLRVSTAFCTSEAGARDDLTRREAWESAKKGGEFLSLVKDTFLEGQRCDRERTEESEGVARAAEEGGEEAARRRVRALRATALAQVLGLLENIGLPGLVGQHATLEVTQSGDDETPVSERADRVGCEVADEGHLFQGRRVTVVHPGTPAEAAGLREGMVLVAVDGNGITSNDELRKCFETAPLTFTVEVLHGQRVEMNPGGEEGPEHLRRTSLWDDSVLAAESACRSHLAHLEQSAPEDADPAPGRAWLATEYVKSQRAARVAESRRVRAAGLARSDFMRAEYNRHKIEARMNIIRLQLMHREEGEQEEESAWQYIIWLSNERKRKMIEEQMAVIDLEDELRSAIEDDEEERWDTAMGAHNLGCRVAASAALRRYEAPRRVLVGAESRVRVRIGGDELMAWAARYSRMRHRVAVTFWEEALEAWTPGKNYIALDEKQQRHNIIISYTLRVGILASAPPPELPMRPRPRRLPGMVAAMPQFYERRRVAPPPPMPLRPKSRAGRPASRRGGYYAASPKFEPMSPQDKPLPRRFAPTKPDPGRGAPGQAPLVVTYASSASSMRGAVQASLGELATQLEEDAHAGGADYAALSQYLSQLGRGASTLPSGGQVHAPTQDELALLLRIAQAEGTSPAELKEAIGLWSDARGACVDGRVATGNSLASLLIAAADTGDSCPSVAEVLAHVAEIRANALRGRRSTINELALMLGAGVNYNETETTGFFGGSLSATREDGLDGPRRALQAAAVRTEHLAASARRASEAPRKSPRKSPRGSRGGSPGSRRGSRRGSPARLAARPGGRRASFLDPAAAPEKAEGEEEEEEEEDGEPETPVVLGMLLSVAAEREALLPALAEVTGSAGGSDMHALWEGLQRDERDGRRALWEAVELTGRITAGRDEDGRRALVAADTAAARRLMLGQRHSAWAAAAAMSIEKAEGLARRGAANAEDAARAQLRVAADRGWRTADAAEAVLRSRRIPTREGAAGAAALSIQLAWRGAAARAARHRAADAERDAELATHLSEEATLTTSFDCAMEEEAERGVTLSEEGVVRAMLQGRAPAAAAEARHRFVARLAAEDYVGPAECQREELIGRTQTTTLEDYGWADLLRQISAGKAEAVRAVLEREAELSRRAWQKRREEESRPRVLTELEALEAERAVARAEMRGRLRIDEAEFAERREAEGRWRKAALVASCDRRGADAADSIQTLCRRVSWMVAAEVPSADNVLAPPADGKPKHQPRGHLPRVMENREPPRLTGDQLRQRDLDEFNTFGAPGREAMMAQFRHSGRAEVKKPALLRPLLHAPRPLHGLHAAAAAEGAKWAEDGAALKKPALPGRKALQDAPTRGNPLNPLRQSAPT